MPQAFNYLDWSWPIVHGFFLIKIALLPFAALVSYVAKRREKKTGVKPHQSDSDRGEHTLWSNPTIPDPPSHPEPPTPPPPAPDTDSPGYWKPPDR